MLVHRSSISRWLSVVCTAAFVALAGLGIGCSEDDIVGDATAEAVEAGLNDVLADTVSPLFQFFGDVTPLVTGGAGRASLGFNCPNTASFCDGGGSVVCTSDGNQFTFTFDQCNKVTGDIDYTLDGVLLTSPGPDPIDLTFQNLFLTDTSPALNGTGSASITNCNYTVNVSTDDSTITGTIIQCDADEFPQASPASHLTIGLDDATLDISFDGSSVANATAFQGGEDIAECDINMANQPATSSCHAP